MLVHRGALLRTLGASFLGLPSFSPHSGLGFGLPLEDSPGRACPFGEGGDVSTPEEEEDMRRQRVTLKEIARRLGISDMTVSRALSADPRVSDRVAEKTRKRVESMATEMGYTPNLLARSFATGKTGTLGLLTFKIYRETFGSQADQILRAAKRQNYQILVSLAADRFSEASLDDQIEQIKELIARGVEGLLINTRGEEDESERILNTVKGRVPVVTFGHPTTQDLSGVVLDDTASFAEITAHLIRLGHQRIGFIGSDWNRSRVGSAKGRGYFQAMQEHGLTPERLPGNPLIRFGLSAGPDGPRPVHGLCLPERLPSHRTLSRVAGGGASHPRGRGRGGSRRSGCGGVFLARPDHAADAVRGDRPGGARPHAGAAAGGRYLPPSYLEIPSDRARILRGECLRGRSPQDIARLATTSRDLPLDPRPKDRPVRVEARTPDRSPSRAGS